MIIQHANGPKGKLYHAFKKEEEKIALILLYVDMPVKKKKKNVHT